MTKEEEDHRTLFESYTMYIVNLPWLVCRGVGDYVLKMSTFWVLRRVSWGSKWGSVFLRGPAKNSNDHNRHALKVTSF